MNHINFSGTHREIGFRWGRNLLLHGINILRGVPFPVTEDRIVFARECLPYYEKYAPQILEEIYGIAQGQQIEEEKLLAVLLSMYCIGPQRNCSTFAFQKDGHFILGRNSDFLTAIEKLYLNCTYHFADGGYAFCGNTTAYAEMEDGINEHGLAVGLMSVYPVVRRPGLNAGLLLRLGLETCSTTEEFLALLDRVPIASSHNFIVMDRIGDGAMVECNAEKTVVRRLNGPGDYVCAVNLFQTEEMRSYRTSYDNWSAEERLETMKKALGSYIGKAEEIESNEADPEAFSKKLLGGAYGFMCQYDRSTGKDTVWAVVYDTVSTTPLQCDGNPGRAGVWNRMRPFH